MDFQSNPLANSCRQQNTLAGESGGSTFGKTNRWHMETLHRLTHCEPAFFVTTPFVEVEIADASAVGQASKWCEDLTNYAAKEYSRSRWTSSRADPKA